ncbi:HNH endonuclease [Sphingobacterium spiritivorum]
MLGDTIRKHYLGKQSTPKRCRFSNKTSDQFSFKMEAHIILQFMGNKNLLSNFECDDCNQKFSKYEDSFANFIGASRTIAQIPGQAKNKVPNLKILNLASLLN